MSLFKTHYHDDTYDGQGAERSGARMEVISHSWEEGEMSWKYPHNEIHKGNHLIVNDRIHREPVFKSGTQMIHDPCRHSDGTAELLEVQWKDIDNATSIDELRVVYNNIINDRYFDWD